MKKIPFNKPYVSGKEAESLKQAAEKGQLSGNGFFTKKCHSFFKQRYNFNECLLTTSCTDALEMSALILNIQPGDEVIMPSYTFVSTANAFALRGAKIKFCDSRKDHPGIDEDQIENLITPKTRLIVAVHYAGVASNMDKIMSIARKHSLYVVEDAAQAINSSYNGKPLGSIGDLGALSFHETKNIHCGEGGLLIINNQKYFNRAEIIWEKGTNRAEFWRGEAEKYEWKDLGSSYLPSELNAAFLSAQLEELNEIQKQRVSIWNRYMDGFSELRNKIQLPIVPEYATNNGHLFYLVCSSHSERSQLMNYLKAEGIHAIFHYLALHESPYYLRDNPKVNLPEAERYQSCLLRLPFHYNLSEAEQVRIIECVKDFYINRSN